MQLEGRSAVVAGGAGGLGGATVRRLADAGVGVVVLDPAAEDGVRGDSNDDAAVAEAVDAARALGTFSIAVSATGVIIASQPLLGRDGTILSTEVLEANWELHVRGPFNLARHAAAAFADNEPDDDGQRGVIVQTASISAFDGQVTMVPYSAAKGAVVSMTLPMARDLARFGVRVCAIAPGTIATPRIASPALREALGADVLFPKRLGHAEEYASLVEAILRNPYLNGEVIRLDGGLRLPPVMGRPG